MKKTSIRIGTRGSQLALYQAERVKAEIEKVNKDIRVEINVIKTKGDRVLDTSLSKIGTQGLFTKEIEIALLEKEIDIAVHSLKDLATDLPEGLQLSAVLKRGEYRDALVHVSGKSLLELTSDDVIATSSLRRVAALKKLKPDVQIIDIRGNVNTRLEKMKSGYCTGMIMAAAGLERLGFAHHISEIISPEKIIPAVSQGAIALESRINDEHINQILEKINHTPTFNTILGERKFLNHIQGGCQVPIGCYSTVKDTIYTLTGFVSSLDGKSFLKETVMGNINNTEALGKSLAEKLIELGSEEILKKIRANN